MKTTISPSASDGTSVQSEQKPTPCMSSPEKEMNCCMASNGSKRSNAPFFSCIVAGCQVASYLPKALESVANQTFRDFEAICFVEESTDGSLEICRRMAEKDSRFKVVSAPRSGAVATTRNYGIDHAAGEYLVVLDGDDWLATDMLAKISAKLKETGEVDVMAFAAKSVTSEECGFEQAVSFSNFKASDSKQVFSGLEAIRRAGKNGGQFFNYTWLNAYRTEFLRAHSIRQTDGILMEDLESTPRIWFFAERVCYLNEPLYVYRRRPNSLTTEGSGRILGHLAKQLRSLETFVAMHEIPCDILSIWSNQWLSVLYWFAFHPVSSAKVADADRRRALESLFAEGGREMFLRLGKRASLPKRVAMPLVFLAARGWQWPAKLFFRQVYYPLIQRRGK